MVFFNCNACGEAVKKNQVDKHVGRCRGCEVLSCVDCGKDFWGDDYQSHNKCMTEEEKYCGKNYVPKVNKGEVKQEQWIEKVQRAIQQSASNPSLRGLLEKLKEYPNIPRKQQKFKNFLVNSLRVRNPGLIDKVWDILMSASDQNPGNQLKNNAPPLPHQNELLKDTPPVVSQACEEQKSVEDEKKPSKRERKEERQEKMNKKEKKDKAVNGEEEKPEAYKNKKRKREDIENGDNESQENGEGTHSKKKKKKKKHANGVCDVLIAGSNGSADFSRLQDKDQEITEVPSPNEIKKFRWKEVIVQVLESKGEISLKKLRRKVLNEFQALGAAHYNKENLQAKFEKKIKKMHQVKIAKDRVKLK